MMPAAALRMRKSVIADPYFSSVVFLANFDSSITDVKGKTITVTGTPVINNTIPFAGGNSCRFDGSTASLTLADSPDWNFDVPFTYEGWVYREAGGDPTIGLMDFGGVAGLNYQASNAHSDVDGTFHINMNANTDGSSPIANNASFGGWALNRWDHYSIGWDGTTYRCFANGVLGLSITDSRPTFDPPFGVLFGAYPNGSWNAGLVATLKGAFGPHRITKGVNRYVSNYTPAQALFPTS